jgi:hypothetical protein
MRMVRTIACGVALALAAISPAAAQDADEIRARELRARIQKQLGEIDEMLLEADKVKPAEVAAKGEEVKKAIDELLATVQTKQSQVVSDIEEMIRLVKYRQNNQSQSQSQSEGEQSQSGGSPKPSERDREGGSDELKRQGEPKEGEQPGKEQEGEGQEGEQPQGGEPDGGEGEQESGSLPPGEKERFQREDVTGRWGVLPPKVAEPLQRLGADEFPERYRKLILRYYRTVNERPERQ